MIEMPSKIKFNGVEAYKVVLNGVVYYINNELELFLKVEKNIVTVYFADYESTLKNLEHFVSDLFSKTVVFNVYNVSCKLETFNQVFTDLKRKTALFTVSAANLNF